MGLEDQVGEALKGGVSHLDFRPILVLEGLGLVSSSDTGKLNSQLTGGKFKACIVPLRSSIHSVNFIQK
jgi:hypothetical protein